MLVNHGAAGVPKRKSHSACRGTIASRLAHSDHISQKTTVRMSHDELLYPFQVQLFKLCSCRRFMSVQKRSSNVYCNVSKPSKPRAADGCFTRTGILNACSQRTWAVENPHHIQETRFQQQFAINVGFVLLHPHELLARLWVVSGSGLSAHCMLGLLPLSVAMPCCIQAVVPKWR